MEKGSSFIETIQRFVRETTGQKVFTYNPNFINESVPRPPEIPATAPKTLEASWKKNPNGSITVGKEQVQRAIEVARAQKSEQAATVIGLSVAYIREHFPQALQDAKYDE